MIHGSAFEYTVLILGAIFSVIAAVCILRLFVLLRQLSASFSKLGYLIREDTKKYFDEATRKVIETNELFRESYVQIVEEGTKNALTQTSHSIEGAIVTAQQEANSIILRARDDARRINIEARKMAVDEMSKSLDNAADTLTWVMGRYVDETFDIQQHRALIDRLVNEYINEYQN